jgi:hypothetical protein
MKSVRLPGGTESITMKNSWIARHAPFGSALISAAVAAGLLLTGPVSAADDDALRVVPRAGSTAGGLNVRIPLRPSDNFDFRSCEGVVYGDKSAQSTGLFLVKVSSDPAIPGIHWIFQNNTYSYQWKYVDGIQVDFAATPDKHSLKLRYTVRNDSQTVLPRVMLHTCVPTTEAPSFFPPPLEHAGIDRDGKPTKMTAYLSLNDRVFLWSKGKRFAFSETENGKDEVHLAFTRKGMSPIQWAWWKNGKETFDVPLIAVASKDGRLTAALGFQDGIWATCNTGDDRACFHLFPYFGTLKPGESATVEGRFYLLQGGPDAALAQFRKDFPR